MAIGISKRFIVTKAIEYLLPNICRDHARTAPTCSLPPANLYSQPLQLHQNACMCLQVTHCAWYISPCNNNKVYGVCGPCQCYFCCPDVGDIDSNIFISYISNCYFSKAPMLIQGMLNIFGGLLKYQFPMDCANTAFCHATV